MFQGIPASAMPALSSSGLAFYLPDTDLVVPFGLAPDAATSRVCIYCRAETTGHEPPDHPCPQALGTRRYPLPRGAVCFRCNQYLKDLDQHVCNHHHIAAMIVFGGIAGTHGRARRVVHENLAFDIATRRVTITVSKKVSGEVRDGRLSMNHPGARFDEWKFSRGLHRMALGVVALAYGSNVALERDFDAVRQYVRRPNDRRVMPYYQCITDHPWGNRTLARAVAEGWYYFGFDLARTPALVYLNLLVDEFVVALNGSLADVSPADVTTFAATSGTPMERLSRREWGFLPARRSARET